MFFFFLLANIKAIIKFKYKIIKLKDTMTEKHSGAIFLPKISVT